MQFFIKNKNTIILSVFGFISGILSYFATINLGEGNVVPPNSPVIPLEFMAGLIFGIAVAIFSFTFLEKYRYRLIKFILWIVISTVSYYIAFWSTFLDIPKASEPSSFIIPEYPFLIGGAVGAFCMLLGFQFLISKLTLQQFISLTIIGSILGLSWFLGKNAALPNAGNSSNEFFLSPFFYLYLVWQTGMALGLGWCLDRNQKKTV